MNHPTDFQFNEYLDNALDEKTKRGIESHLQVCEDCSARLDELKTLFSKIESLPEVKLRRDLSPFILARLSPQQSLIWTPFFAAQVGAALGIFFWLSMQTTNFFMPIIFNFHFPQFIIPNIQFVMPALQFPNSLFTILHSPFSTFNLSTFDLIFISTSVFLLWLVGNLSLLRNRSGVQK